jgi:hypothetical protein
MGDGGAYASSMGSYPGSAPGTSVSTISDGAAATGHGGAQPSAPRYGARPGARGLPVRATR